MAYRDAGARFAREKKHTIEGWVRSDERKDWIIASSRVPTGVTCNTCGGLMRFEMHDFVNGDADLIFFFSCPNGHAPRKAIYTNGREHFFRKRSCSYCRGELVSKTKKAKHQMKITDTCRVCDKVEVFEYEVTPKKIFPINEAERKKYCADFIGSRTFEDDLQALAVIADLTKPSDKKTRISIKNVRQMNIAQMEKMLTEAIEKSGFIKVAFEKPKTDRYLTVAFSAQDPSDRNEQKSIKALKAVIHHVLFPTNWRLMSPGIDYKLGFLSGQLKGFSVEEDLLKIAQEISEKTIVKWG